MRWVFDNEIFSDDANWILVPDDVSDERAITESSSSYGWIWVSERKLTNNGGYAAVIMIRNITPAAIFDTLEEAKEWLVAAVTYFKITGEVPPKDIHKREGL